MLFYVGVKGESSAGETLNVLHRTGFEPRTSGVPWRRSLCQINELPGPPNMRTVTFTTVTWKDFEFINQYFLLKCLWFTFIGTCCILTKLSHITRDMLWLSQVHRQTDLDWNISFRYTLQPCKKNNFLTQTKCLFKDQKTWINPNLCGLFGNPLWSHFVWYKRSIFVYATVTFLELDNNNKSTERLLDDGGGSLCWVKWVTCGGLNNRRLAVSLLNTVKDNSSTQYAMSSDLSRSLSK